MQRSPWMVAAALGGVMIASLGCATNSGSSGSGRRVTQLSFETPEDALAALKYLAQTRDREYGQSLFGPEADELSSGDPDVDEYEKSLLAAAVARRHDLRRNADGSIDIIVGENAVEFPVPLVQHEGRWLFDSPAGVDRMRDIRVGYYELKTLEAMRVVPVAQREFRSVDRDGDGVLEYARFFTSSQGGRDGLYWPTGPGEPNSPLGSFFADSEIPRSKELGFNGYFYKMLTAQGPSAPGGAKSFMDGSGNLVDGFAVLAYPAVYGETAIMTFQMGPDGIVYEKDLGSRATRNAGKAITAFDPGSGWTQTND